MAIVNYMSKIPRPGDRVKAVSVDGFEDGSCVDITFENGQTITAHICPDETDSPPPIKKDKELPAFCGDRP